MKINLTEMMRMKGRLTDINSEMDGIFRNVNTEFEDIAGNIGSIALLQSIQKFQESVTAISQKLSLNMNELETFIGEQISSYTITNEEVKESLEHLVTLVNDTFDENGNIILHVSAKSLTTFSAPTLGSGTEINIPDSVRQTGLCPNYTSYTRFYDKWNKGTMQREIANQWGAAGMPSSNGIATLNDRYLVAVSPKFGNVGDNIDIVLNDGQVINATIADMKGGDATSEWGHVLTKSGAVDIIEWEATGSQSEIDLGTWRNVGVDKIVNLNK